MNNKKLIFPVCLLISLLLSACSLQELDDLNNKYENKAIAVTPTASLTNAGAKENPQNTVGTSESAKNEASADASAASDNASTGSEGIPTDTRDSTAGNSSEDAQQATDGAAVQGSDSTSTAEEPDTSQPSGNNPAGADDTLNATDGSDEQYTATPPTGSTQADNGTATGADSQAVSEDGTGEVSSDYSDNTVNEDSLVQRDIADRSNYRDMTFLIWAPAFEYGVFSGKDSGSTYDYATFTGVSEEEYLRYKSLLTNAGYTTILSDTGSLYKVRGTEKWCITLEYDNGSLRLGAGFDEAASSNDRCAVLYATTMLQYIPEFTHGTYTTDESEGDETEFTYIYYSNVSAEEVRSYINSLKNSGYIYGVEEGDSDGIIWYIALNEEVFSCYVAYDNGILKLGCGYGD